MKTITTNLAYKNVSEDIIRENTINYLEGAVILAYPNLPREKSRMYARIQDKFELVKKDKLNELTLEDTEFDFIYKDCFLKASYPPPFSKDLVILEDELERVSKTQA